MKLDEIWSGFWTIFHWKCLKLGNSWLPGHRKNKPKRKAQEKPWNTKSKYRKSTWKKFHFRVKISWWSLIFLFSHFWHPTVCNIRIINHIVEEQRNGKRIVFKYYFAFFNKSDNNTICFYAADQSRFFIFFHMIFDSVEKALHFLRVFSKKNH